MSSSPPQLEDVRELMQLIQLHLPIKEAARTSVLSKSWLNAWSTISTLRFHIPGIMTLEDMDRILTMYLRDNIPIERFHLDIAFTYQESASLAETCIRTMATHKNSTILKELSLTYRVYGAPLIDLPHEILSCENLTKITVLSTQSTPTLYTPIWMKSTHSHDPVIINCVSLRELVLNYVNISQELLDGILSSCRLLVKINLIKSSNCLNTIKVNNLPCLYELKIVTGHGSSTALEINHVPNLGVFTWEQQTRPLVPFNAHSISFGSSLKELTLGHMVTYKNASLNMIKSGATLLKSLTLDMANWELGSFHFTCASIKRLSLLWCRPKLIDVKVYAPNLLFFLFDGIDIMPSLLFPVSTLIKETTFRLNLYKPFVDVSFHLKVREALTMLSSNCDIHITMWNYGHPVHPAPALYIDIDDLRTRLQFPIAMNVQRLSFQTRCDKFMWERSHFFDAFFEICHPKYITAKPDMTYQSKNHFCKVMLTEVLEKKNSIVNPRWPRYLKHVQIKGHEKWETLTNSHKSLLKGPNPYVEDFKLEWR